ncbi:MAG: TIGR03943 family protein [Actinomycetota bacterium]|nr:TIGR03943 family protein [Actinomycetota bacterium]
MNKATQSAVVGLLGGLLIFITVTGRYTAYVKPGFAPLLLLAGVVLIAVGLASVIPALGMDHPPLAMDHPAPVMDHPASGLDQPASAPRNGDVDQGRSPLPAHGVTGHADSHAHSHDRATAPWLILAPILILFLLAPPALGADAVSRNAGSQALAGLAGVAPPAAAGADVGAGGSPGGYAPNDGSGHAIGTKAFAQKRPTMTFPALPGGKDPSLALKDFVMRALYDGQNSASDNDLTVIGFIAPTGDGYPQGFSLARVTISCCAADASPLRVHIDGTARYPVDTWVSAVISARPGTAGADNDYVPTVDVTSMVPIAQPADPYEH